MRDKTVRRHVGQGRSSYRGNNIAMIPCSAHHLRVTSLQVDQCAVPVQIISAGTPAVVYFGVSQQLRARLL